MVPSICKLLTKRFAISVIEVMYFTAKCYGVPTYAMYFSCLCCMIHTAKFGRCGTRVLRGFHELIVVAAAVSLNSQRS